MTYFTKTFSLNAKRNPLENKSFMEGRIGFWGTVTQVNNKAGTCNVRMDTGFEIKNIPVASKEYVNLSGNFQSGEKDLPTVDSIVFVLTPTRTSAGAFILCSGFCKQQNDFEKSDANVKKIVTQSGWIITEDKTSGDLLIQNQNNSLSIKLDNTNKEINFNNGNLEVLQ